MCWNAVVDRSIFTIFGPAGGVLMESTLVKFGPTVAAQDCDGGIQVHLCSTPFESGGPYQMPNSQPVLIS